MYSFSHYSVESKSIWTICHVYKREIIPIIRYDIFALYVPLKKTSGQENNTLKCYDNEMGTYVKVRLI